MSAEGQRLDLTTDDPRLVELVRQLRAEGQSGAQITVYLNASDFRCPGGGAWTPGRVLQLLARLAVLRSQAPERVEAYRVAAEQVERRRRGGG